MASKSISIIAIILGLAFLSAIIYAGTMSSRYEGAMAQKESTINSLQSQVQQLTQTKTGVSVEQKATSQAPPTEVTSPKKGITPLNVEEAKAFVASTVPAPSANFSLCIECHGNVTGFHQIALLQKVDAKRGITPARICTTCHGTKIHTIHASLINKYGASMCKFCHLRNGEFQIPKKSPGQVLVCQQCHFNGSYILIHRGVCSRCHYGTLNDIHGGVLKQLYAGIYALENESLTEVNQTSP